MIAEGNKSTVSGLVNWDRYTLQASALDIVVCGNPVKIFENQAELMNC